MFDSKRYITNGISTAISQELQLYLWALIDIQKGQGLELDYLQIFRLEPVISEDGLVRQKIIHLQEEPDRESTTIISIDDPIHEKVFVIDSEEYVTMLLASEY